ncbi:hypothetical protein [Burkholderia ubonensis]|uniref:hypothetical protein n=1 Tax=Burkholderia ubonensis TaxID=101571 RepID=UPI00075C7C82|nr:hypothetical protein [Burkholderia ubonensis]
MKATLTTMASTDAPVITRTLDYLRIEQLLELIDEPARAVCQRLLSDNRALFERTQGSTHNHQVWVGGYIDHVTDGLNYARHLYAMTSALGRPLPFSLSDALLVFYLHDLEKPWRILVLEDGSAVNRVGLDTKAAFKAFREDKLAEYGLTLTPAQLNGLTYVEGELRDYSSTRRVMNELAGFCHMVDVWSARIGYAYPKVDDEWVGAGRVRTVSHNECASTACFHYWDFLDAKHAAPSTVRSKVINGWKLYRVNQGFGAAGGTANYQHALVGPGGELMKVSERTVDAAGVEVEPEVLHLNVLVFLLDGVYKSDLTAEAIRRGLSSADDLNARWNGELRRWMVRPEARAEFAQWLSADAQPTHMFPSMPVPAST